MVRPEPAHFGPHLVVGEVTRDLVDPLDGELVVGVVVDLTDHLFGNRWPTVDMRPRREVVWGARSRDPAT